MLEIEVPPQTVKVKTLVGMYPDTKIKLLAIMWDVQNDTLWLLRSILQTDESRVQYLEAEWLSLDDEIPLRIFMDDTWIPQEIKRSIEKLYRSILFAKKLRYITSPEEALRMVQEEYWQEERPISIKNTLMGIKKRRNRVLFKGVF